MHKVTIYLRPGRGGLFPEHFKTIQEVNKHEIVFHNLKIH